MSPGPDTPRPGALARARQRLFETVLAALFVVLVAPAVAGVAAWVMWLGLAEPEAGPSGVLGLLGVLTGAYILGALPSLLAGAAVPWLAPRLGRQPTALLAGLGAALLWAVLSASPLVAVGAPPRGAPSAVDWALLACAALGVYIAVLLHLRNEARPH